jgi:hypothetical protein
MSGVALRLAPEAVVAGPGAAPDAPQVAGDALNAQRRANALTARALARGRLLLDVLTGGLPASGESFPPRG